MVRIINWTLWLEAIDAAAARHLSPGAQGRMDCLAPIRDEAEFDPGAAGRMRGAFFRNSRSMRRGSFSRRGRAISAARSAPAERIAAARSNTRAAIPHSPDHRHSARRAASKRQSPVPGQSGSTAGRCSSAAPPPPA
jgi:hypothetical protein